MRAPPALVCAGAQSLFELRAGRDACERGGRAAMLSRATLPAG
ncbi:unnamed protein product [Mycetohabitans rhizoxinica HKI 454]|uniref:Uncharacterized protein n=1 Tax=Mycetohabitans rhizoxinica (strain DSM 19002 / CIP 109453 / HKI 454) TaxID=882378 RepID=E5AR05_MYCRK|nr:unnamed protein product [Mycetohabitans rhizoxinica HKI 454]